MVVTLSEPEIDRIFHALADATRRDIVARANQQSQSVSALAQHYAMSFAAVQKHVAVLERASLVTKTRSGREQLVHSNLDTLRTAARLLDEFEQVWLQRAHRIQGLLAERPDSTHPARTINTGTHPDNESPHDKE